MPITFHFKFTSITPGRSVRFVPCCARCQGTEHRFTLQMIRAIRTRPPFALSRIFRTGLCTTAPLSFPEGHGLLPTSQSPITPKPHFFNSVSTDGKQLPTYRIIDGVGNVIEGAELPEACPNSCALLSRVLIVMPA
jgi:hypothetical protein